MKILKSTTVFLISLLLLFQTNPCLGRDYRIAFVYTGGVESKEQLKTALVRILQKYEPLHAANFSLEDGRHDGDSASLRESLIKLDATNPTLIFAQTAGIAQAAVEAKLRAPIVFRTYSDFSSLQVANAIRSPERNATGINGFVGLEQKRLELLLLIGGVKKIGVLLDSSEPTSTRINQEIDTFAAANAKVQIEKLWVSSEREMKRVEMWLRGKQLHGVYVPQHNAFVQNRAALVEMLGKLQIPAIYESNGFVKSGGLMAYETDFGGLEKQLAKIIVQVASGMPPKKIPIVTPESFSFLVNLDTAKKLKLSLSQDLLSRVNKFVSSDSALNTNAGASTGVKTHPSR